MENNKSSNLKCLRASVYPRSLPVKSNSAVVALMMDSFTSQELLCMQFCMFLRGQGNISQSLKNNYNYTAVYTAALAL